MSERKNIEIGKLRIWTDNPRYGNLSNFESLMSENEAINLLIDVVGEKKMLNLARDIIENNGLNANVLPTVVQKGDVFFVYDGNRRVSSIKIIKDPAIIEDKFYTLKKGVRELIKSADLSFLDNLFVYITSEDEALLLMDKTHSGEQDGVGVISWDAFNRDISLNKRGKALQYPVSFKIANIMNWSRKKEFQIPYTDFQRLFSSRALLNSFGIDNLDNCSKEQVETAITALLLYKQERGFNSFSRQFNITEVGEGDDLDKPINNFINWWQVKQLAESLYVINVDAQTIFTDSVFELDYSKIHIIRRDNKQEMVAFDNSELEIQFFDPAGKKKKDLDPKIGGYWTMKVFYKGVVGNGSVFVKTVALTPDVRFDNSKLHIKKGESLNLQSVIQYAKTIHDNEMSLVSVTPVGDNNPVIDNLVFSADNKVDEYILSFRFDNDGEEYSTNVTIVVEPIMKPAINKTVELPFSFLGNSEITFSSDVANLIIEINELWPTKRFKHMICCSARAVAELSFDCIESIESSVFSSSKDLKNRIQEFADYLLSNRNVLTDICNKMKLKYTNVQNQLLQLKGKAEEVATALHLGAHKSSSVLDIENLYDKMRVYLCLIVQCAEGFKLI